MEINRKKQKESVFFQYPVFLISVVYFLASPVLLAQAEFRFRIDFTDKNNSPFSLAVPEQFLAQRSIERRLKQAIDISIDDLPPNSHYIDSILSLGEVRLLNRSKWFNAITISSTDSSIINQINNLPFVKKTSRYRESVSTLSYEKLGETEFPDVEKNYKLFMKNSAGEGRPDYGFGYPQVEMIHMDSIHALGYRGEGMLIAVLDAGFISADTMEAFSHLFQNNKIMGVYNFVDGNDSVYRNATHGTFVLSTMAAWLPGLLVGTAPRAGYLLLISEDMKSETILEEFNWVAAAEFADSAGADIINSSLGYTTFDNNENNHSYADMDGNTAIATLGADIAASKGILVVNSAGNSGSSEWNFIGVPADADSVLAVGAVDINRKYASFSSNGPSSDGRIKPDVSAMGLGTVFASLNDSIAAGNGTSFSSPLVAGAAACLWQEFRDKSNMAVLEAIRRSSSQYFQPDTLLGYGIPNFITAYHILQGKKIPDFSSDTLLVSPNPFREFLTVNFYSKVNQKIYLSVFSAEGKSLFSTEKKAIEGLNEYFIYGEDIVKNGILFLEIITGRDKFIRKIIRI